MLQKQKDMEDQYQNEELKQLLKQLQKTYDSQIQDLKTYRKTIEQYDKEKEQLMEEKQKLEKENEQKKNGDFERKIKSIIERLPCQIEIKSLRQISNSTIKKARNVVQQLVIAYKNAYNEDYHNRQSENYQSLFESFYIIGVKHKQLHQTQGNLKPKFLYKQYKYQVTSEERNSLEQIESDIEIIFEKNLLQVEKMNNDKTIGDKILGFIHPINDKKNLMDNFFFINLRCSDNIFNNVIPANMKLLTEVNNQKQAFIFVLAIDDFMTSFKEDRFKFWKVKKFYCILTYFPVFEIFEKILLFLENNIQTSRQRLYKLLKEQQNVQKIEIQFMQKIYQDIDALNIIHASKDNIQNYLCELSKKHFSQNQPNFDFHFPSNLTIKDDRILQQHLTYSVDNLRIKNMFRSTHVVMSIFCDQQTIFFNILIEILKEGQIIFCCDNVSILVQVCYFFHQIVFPFIYSSPVLYYTYFGVVEQMLDQELPFIVGINKSYNQLKSDLIKYDSQSLNSETLTIVELCNNQTAIIHQYLPRDPHQINMIFPNNQFQDIFQNYRTVSQTLQAEKCQQLLFKINSKIENDFRLQIVPDKDENFVNNDGQLNVKLIEGYMNEKLKNNENRAFIMDNIFWSSYFQTYLKHKFNCSFN